MQKERERAHILGAMKSIPSGWKWLSDLEFYNMYFFFFGKTQRETRLAQRKLIALISPNLLALRGFSFIWVTFCLNELPVFSTAQNCHSITMNGAQWRKRMSLYWNTNWWWWWLQTRFCGLKPPKTCLIHFKSVFCSYLSFSGDETFTHYPLL